MDDRLGAVAGRGDARVLELAAVLLRECNRRMSSLFFDIELENAHCHLVEPVDRDHNAGSKRRCAVRFAPKRSPKKTSGGPSFPAGPEKLLLCRQ